VPLPWRDRLGPTAPTVAQAIFFANLLAASRI